MSTNRHALQNSDIVKFPQLLEKGIPLPFLENKITVPDGWVAVISEGGVYKETLPSGTHFLGKYKLFRELRSIEVDTRIKTLNVITDREFTISQPVPVEVNIDLAVEYRVVDPRRVALEMTTPLLSFFDRVLQALRGAVVNAHLDEIRRQGSGIAEAVHRQLQSMKLPQTMGIEVLNVLTTRIKATDTGNDAMATRQLEWWTRMQDAVVNGQIYQHINVTPQYLMLSNPDLYAKLQAGQIEVLKELIDKGMLDPSGIMNQPTRSTGGAINDIGTQILSGFLGMGIPGHIPDQSPQSGGSTPQLNPPAPVNDIHKRIDEEVKMLQKTPGVQVEVKAGVNERNIPDGSYNLLVAFSSSSNNTQFELFITCLSSYPSQPPEIELVQNGEDVPFQSTILRRWSGQWLVEIVREIRQFYS